MSRDKRDFTENFRRCMVVEGHFSGILSNFLAKAAVLARMAALASPAQAMADARRPLPAYAFVSPIGSGIGFAMTLLRMPRAMRKADRTDNPDPAGAVFRTGR